MEASYLFIINMRFHWDFSLPRDDKVHDICRLKLLLIGTGSESCNLFNIL